MTDKLNPVDVLISGLGWTGGIIAKKQADSGLKFAALERGGPRNANPDFLDPQIHDEPRYAARHDLIQNVRRETLRIAGGGLTVGLLIVLPALKILELV